MNISYNMSRMNGNVSSPGTGSEHETATVLLIPFVFLTFLAVGIMAANYLVIYLVRKKDFLKTATNTCLVSLAASDFLAGAVAIPMLFACNLSPTASEYLCIAMDLCSRFIAIATVLHLLVVTLERYLMIVHAMRYPLLITKRRIIGLLVALWVISLAASLVQIAWAELKPQSQQSRKNDIIYDLVILLGVVFPSFSVMAFSYFRIFATLREQLARMNSLQLMQSTECPRRRRNKLGDERKAMMLFGFLILSFIVCWFSYFLDSLRTDLDMKGLVQVPFWAQCLLVVLRFSSSLINPLVYTFFKRDFKKAMCLILRRRSLRLSRSALIRKSIA